MVIVGLLLLQQVICQIIQQGAGEIGMLRQFLQCRLLAAVELAFGNGRFQIRLIVAQMLQQRGQVLFHVAVLRKKLRNDPADGKDGKGQQ